MPALPGSVVSFLEQSQTCRSEDLDTEALFKNLLAADAVVEQKVEDWDVASLQQVVSLLCSWLRAHEDFSDSSCLRLIFKLLAKLLGREQTVDQTAVHKGCISSCTAVLGAKVVKRFDAPLVKCCLEVLTTLSTVENSDTILQRQGSVALVVELMQRHRDNPSILEDGATALAVMSNRTRHRKAFSNCSGMPVLIDLLKRYVDQPTLVVAICRFIINFAVKDETRQIVQESGGVDALVAGFDSPATIAVRGGSLTATDVRATIAAAIWACSTDCPAVQNMLLASGWLASLASVLQANKTHAGLHEAAMGIVRQVSKNAQYREEIVNLNFVPTTNHAMRTFRQSQVLLKEACGVVGNLAADADIRQQLGESGAVDEVVAVLGNCRTHEDRKVAKLALGSLANLSNCELNRDILSRCDAVSILLAVNRFYMQNEMILESALGVLGHVAMHEACCQQLLQAGGIEALLLFLEEHRADMPVVSRSLVTLRRIVRLHLEKGDEQVMPILQQISRAGRPDGHQGIVLVLEALQAHIYDETVAKEASLLLLSLSRVMTNIPALMSLAVKPCMKTLEVHKNDQPVSDAVCALLAALPLEDTDWDAPSSSPLSRTSGVSPAGGGLGGYPGQRPVNFAM